jgi:hypothetical protein
MKPDKRTKFFLKKTDDKYEDLYLLHHMHHFKSGKNIEHELHHCFLFEKKNMKGKKYSIRHRFVGRRLLHCVTDIFEGKLYDHRNNQFMVELININDKKLAVIKI